jgi:peptidoglycan hydrolase-like protein with peptidoglycan-binding domain
MAIPLGTIGLLTLLASLLRNGQRGGGLTEPMPPPGVLDQPQPFPQVTPTGLPPFPSGWQYYQPPPHAVVVRSWQLLKDLWSQGEGAYKIEQTGGEWVAYRAEKMADKNGALTVMGVTAWRPRPGASASSVPSASAPTSPAPGARPPLPVIPASYPPPSARGTPAGSPTAGGTLSPAQIQQALNAAGASPPLVVDGKLGPKSSAATLAFQNAHGLVADGIPGPKTQAALAPYLAQSAAPVPVTLPPLPTSYVQPRSAPAPAVLTNTQIQAALNAAGAMPPLVVDGQLGPKSVAAVKSFQSRHPPLAVDGKAGPQTQTALAPYLTQMA